MSEASIERRRFHRIGTDKPVAVRSASGDHAGTTLDVSLRGLLLEPSDGWQPQSGTPVEARIRLDDGDDCCIDLQGRVAHVDARRIGIHVTAVDVESASRLRRMVELNLGDTTLIERELAELIGA
ncbi:MAG: PilZ domain-containing protein [Gammaproteobacteria bacterium]|nr:PilZ domain-containing protein [Gammaproteobacteria bacterium]